jgi:hypothetical protein
VPRKAAYRAFDADPELEFEFFLAQKLGRTVGELRASLSQEEFLYWGMHYARKAQREELEIARAKGGK